VCMLRDIFVPVSKVLHNLTTLHSGKNQSKPVTKLKAQIKLNWVKEIIHIIHVINIHL